MKNYRGEGDAVNVPAATNWADSLFVLLPATGGGIYGVVGASVASGAIGVVHRSGVYRLPKSTGSNWVVGQTVWWDIAGGKAVTASISGGTVQLIGRAMALAPGYTAAAASADAFGDVLLT